MTDFKLDEFLPYQLAVAASRVSRAFSAHYIEKFGISTPEWRVVAHLSQEGSVSVREIHRRVDMDKSKVSRAAGRLEAAGYISKTENRSDRRLVELQLTEKGREMIDQLAPVARGFEQELLAHLGEDGATFRGALDDLLNATAAKH